MSEYWGWDGMSEGLVAERSLSNWRLRKIGGNAVARTEFEKEENFYLLFLPFVCVFLINFADFGLTILQISQLMFLRTIQSTSPLELLKFTQCVQCNLCLCFVDQQVASSITDFDPYEESHTCALERRI